MHSNSRFNVLSMKYAYGQLPHLLLVLFALRAQDLVASLIHDGHSPNINGLAAVQMRVNCETGRIMLVGTWSTSWPKVG
jgi:hypothetical protein